MGTDKTEQYERMIKKFVMEHTEDVLKQPSVASQSFFNLC